MARSGNKMMQFLREGRYVANVVDANGSFGPGHRNVARPHNVVSSDALASLELRGLGGGIVQVKEPDI